MTQAKTEHKCRVINDLLLDLENESSIPFTRSIQHPEMILPISKQRLCFHKILLGSFTRPTSEQDRAVVKGMDPFRIVEVGDGQVSDLVGWTPKQFAAILAEHFLR